MSVFALVVASGAAQAQKVAIVSMQQAVLATTDGKKASATLDAKFGPVKQELDQLQKEIVTKQDQLLKTHASMSPEAVTAAQSEIDSLQTSLKRKTEDAQQDYGDAESKELGVIVPKLQQIINAYAAANHIELVVDTSAAQNNLIYANASTNITAAVVAAYEKAAATAPSPITPAPAK